MHRILKIPFELGIVDKERKGTAEAPGKVQEQVGNLFSSLVGIDWIDVPVEANFDQTQENIYNAAKEQDKIIAVGGDHSVTFGLFKAFAEKNQNIGLVYFDAHLDCQDDFMPPSHEDILKALINKKLIQGKDVIVIGARNWTDKELEFAKENNITILDSFGVYEEKLKEFIEKHDSIYISLDIDAVDPAFAPGTGWIESAGLTAKELMQYLKILRGANKVQGFDIVEISPKRDINEMTSKLGAKLLIDFLNAP